MPRKLRSTHPQETLLAERLRQRDVLPVPDITPVGLTTDNAKDPDTALYLKDGRPRYCYNLLGPDELLRVAMARQ